MRELYPPRALLLLLTHDGEDVGREGGLVAEIPWTQATWEEVVPRVYRNSAMIEFSIATRDVGKVDGCRVLDADTGIQLNGLLEFMVPKLVLTGDAISFQVNCLSLDWREGQIRE